MLDRLRRGRPGRARSTAVLGDMVDDLPAGPFDVVLVAYNTLFNLRAPSARQPASPPSPPGWRRAARSWSRRSCPRTRHAAAPVVAVRSMTATRGRAVDLRPRPRRRSGPTATSSSSPTANACACGRGRSATPRRPSSTRMAAAAGLRRWRHRWEDFDGHPFGDDSARHVSVYALRRTAGGGNACNVRSDGSYPGAHCESDASQSTHRAVGHDRGRAGATTDRLRAARAPRSSRPDRPCPFCPGNEESTLPALETVDDGGSWRMRVVPNLYPAFDGDDRLRGPPPRPGARHGRGQRHPRGVRLHARPRRRPRPARRRARPPS